MLIPLTHRDQRIERSGCATENAKLQDCYYETHDWRKCTKEMMEFRECFERQQAKESKSKQ